MLNTEICDVQVIYVVGNYIMQPTKAGSCMFDGVFKCVVPMLLVQAYLFFIAKLPTVVQQSMLAKQVSWLLCENTNRL